MNSSSPLAANDIDPQQASDPTRVEEVAEELVQRALRARLEKVIAQEKERARLERKVWRAAWISVALVGTAVAGFLVVH